ncbi:hypothetical protein QQF64_028902 [Cirrhinus molitorella]|uniref:Uncharacterized protein n=1 Tax=Cirrhinus molitorella TaxID=172907 RepID=A0ABR3N8J0_9TELE
MAASPAEPLKSVASAPIPPEVAAPTVEPLCLSFHSYGSRLGTLPWLPAPPYLSAPPWLPALFWLHAPSCHPSPLPQSQGPPPVSWSVHDLPRLSPDSCPCFLNSFSHVSLAPHVIVMFYPCLCVMF